MVAKAMMREWVKSMVYRVVEINSGCEIGEKKRRKEKRKAPGWNGKTEKLKLDDQYNASSEDFLYSTSSSDAVPGL